MTGSDLNSSSKPWKVQQKTSVVVYKEFHEQVSWNFCFWSVSKQMNECGFYPVWTDFLLAFQIFMHWDRLCNFAILALSIWRVYEIYDKHRESLQHISLKFHNHPFVSIPNNFSGCLSLTDIIKRVTKHFQTGTF